MRVQVTAPTRDGVEERVYNFANEPDAEEIVVDLKDVAVSMMQSELSMKQGADAPSALEMKAKVVED